MRSRTAVPAAVTALVLALSSCGGETTDADSAPDPQETSTTAESTENTVTGVTVQQSGGLAGLRRIWQVSAGASNADRVFAAASADGFVAAAADDSAAPTVPCCDFFVYDITVRYSDGDALRVRTSEAGRPDPAVTRLLQAVLSGDPPRTAR